MSRTLGFIAGLTVPAGLYYISTLHLDGTATQVVSSLDEQEKRLRSLDRLPPAQPTISGRKTQDDFLSRVKDGWNNTVEETVHKLQKVDYGEAAEKTATAASNLSQNAWEKTKPELEKAGEQAKSLAEQAKQAASEAAAKTEKAAEAAKESTERGLRQTAGQVQEATQETSEMLAAWERAALEKQSEARAATERGLRRTASQVQDVTQETSNQLAAWERAALQKSEEASERMRQGWAEAKEHTHDASARARETTAQANAKAAHFLEETKEFVSEKLEQVKQKLSGAAQDAKHSMQGAGHDVKPTSAQILENVKQDAALAKVDAVDRWRAMLDAKDDLAKEKALLLEQYAGRRVGFESVHDPTQAQVIADAAAAGRVARDPEHQAKKSWWFW
ncbi:hypothetical protein BCR37DRAFT_391302 [Protomyces lactucae-debilis]|uniref:MICOS complex subunit MIC12 n=1 Tax=Protomyces lactucae-debilis TaxID=2754530 RepID=A0A1Y2FNJ3_PROLT|nr:uncharacterized protein BCR37DRAFT_391302 [Protomyces lactucae-debilis]ORY85528.1 hypothetical protein BCR37DRAFT_391302 [Protomyces lactucae-debilis]